MEHLAVTVSFEPHQTAIVVTQQVESCAHHVHRYPHIGLRTKAGIWYFSITDKVYSVLI